MARILAIAQLGHPVLRRPAREVLNIHERRIQQLIKDMLATLHEYDGVGLAAPQVFQSYRIMIIASHPGPRYPDAPQMDPVVMINPVLVSQAEILAKGWEGCLSIPGIRGFVPRHRTVTIDYADQFGNKRRRAYRGFVSRIIQHEYDHLDGILFPDRLESTKDLISEKEYLKRYT